MNAHERAASAKLKSQLTILRAFQRYLDATWPGWQRFEGRVMYAALWRAFAAGWEGKRGRGQSS
jgi:hypothetical protein